MSKNKKNKDITLTPDETNQEANAVSEKGKKSFGRKV